MILKKRYVLFQEKGASEGIRILQYFLEDEQLIIEFEWDSELCKV